VTTATLPRTIEEAYTLLGEDTEHSGLYKKIYNLSKAYKVQGDPEGHRICELWMLREYIGDGLAPTWEGVSRLRVLKALRHFRTLV